MPRTAARCRHRLSRKCFLKNWRVRNSAVPVILKCKSPLATPAPRGGPSARMCLSTIDQHAEDACAQHRTKHDVHRFKRVAIPHQNCPNVTTTVFESWTFTGSKFSKCRATAFARSALTPATSPSPPLPLVAESSDLCRPSQYVRASENSRSPISSTVSADALTLCCPYRGPP